MSRRIANQPSFTYPQYLTFEEAAALFSINAGGVVVPHKRRATFRCSATSRQASIIASALAFLQKFPFEGVAGLITPVSAIVEHLSRRALCSERCEDTTLLFFPFFVFVLRSTPQLRPFSFVHCAFRCSEKQRGVRIYHR